MDKADGSGMLLMDLAARDWSRKFWTLWHPPGVSAAGIRGAGNNRHFTLWRRQATGLVPGHR